MIKAVSVTFKMKITQNSESEHIEFDSQGRLLKKNDRYYLKFKEPVVDGPGYNDILLTFNDNSIKVERSGQVKMSQEFEKGKAINGTYKNRYISTKLTTYTNNYKFGNNKIYLDYNMIMNKENVGHYEMEVELKGDDQL